MRATSTPENAVDEAAADKASTSEAPFVKETFEMSDPVPTPTEAPWYRADPLRAVATPTPIARATEGAMFPNKTASAGPETGRGAGTTYSFPVTVPAPTAPTVTPCRTTFAGTGAHAEMAIPTTVARRTNEEPVRSGPAARMAAVTAEATTGTVGLPWEEEVGGAAHPEETEGEATHGI